MRKASPFTVACGTSKSPTQSGTQVRVHIGQSRSVPPTKLASLARQGPACNCEYFSADSIGGKIVRLKYELAKLKDAEKSSFAGRCVQFLLSILSTKEQALTTEQVLQVVETLSTALQVRQTFNTRLLFVKTRSSFQAASPYNAKCFFLAQDIDAEGPDAIIQLESKTCGQLTKQLLRYPRQYSKLANKNTLQCAWAGGILDSPAWEFVGIILKSGSVKFTGNTMARQLF